ncbi:MAG: flavin prenyltransferase UbiX [Nitrospirota bacterium]
MATYTIAITGASGAVYGERLLRVLIEAGHSLYVCISQEGISILNDETNLHLKGSETDIQYGLQKYFGSKEGQVLFFSEDNMYSPIGSGSIKVDAMVVIPCTMKTLASIAHGFASNLIERAADVTIKEKRNLFLVPRETPVSAIHLRNMLKLAELGCQIIPAMPAFYHHPQEVSQLVDFVVGRVLNAMGIENDLAPRWGI